MARKKRIYEEVERIIGHIDQEIARMDRDEARRYWLYSDLWIPDKVMPEFTVKGDPQPDIIEYGNIVSITVELPETKIDNINLDMTESTLRINLSDRNFQQEIVLPVKVLPETMHVTYKNGVLDVVVRRQSPFLL
jgi:HSP20 family molecular chaperone IbpA